MAPKQSKQDPKSRAASTSGLNQPSSTSVLPPAAHPTLCSFNASHSLFASVSRTLGGADKLRLWNTADNRVVGDWDIAPLAGPTVKSSVSCVSFVTLEGGEAAVDSESSARQKKRKKNVEQEVPQSSEVAVLAQGTELLFYGQTSAKQLEKISLGSKIQSLASHAAAGLVVATEKEVIIMDASTGDRLAAYPLPSSLSSTTSIAIHYEDDQLSIILASIQLVVLTVSLPVTSESDHTFSAVQPAGAESIRHLQPISAADDKLVFAAVEENARVASIWQCTLDDESAVPTILASVPCPSSSPVQSLTATQDGILFLLSQAGEAWGYEVTPATLSPAPAPESGNDKKKKRRSVANSSSLKPVITIEPSQGTSLVAIGGVAEQEEEAEDKDDDEEMEVDASARSAVIGRMIGPNRVRWEQVAYRDATGALASEIKLKKPSAELGTSGNDAEVSLQRYRETAHTGSTTTALARDEEAALTRQEMELPVEGEMADMTLGERLLALDPAAAAASAQQRAERAKEPEQDQAAAPQNLAPQSAQSLTRMLLQALHTSDPQLLSLILTSSVNSTPVLIRNTVRRLPASMALPLLKACVDRLGKGRAFGRRGGGRGGGLNERQGSCVVAWIRGVLVERGSVLMTVSPERGNIEALHQANNPFPSDPIASRPPRLPLTTLASPSATPATFAISLWPT